MDSSRLLDSVISRLRDQRFLFALGVIIVVASLAPFHTVAAMAILGSAVIMVMVDRILPASPGQRSFNMSVALDLQGVAETADIRLVRAECTANAPGSGSENTYHLIPYRGGGGQGWLCPLPPDSSPNDSLRFTFFDSDGGQWGTDPVVPALLWPRVDVRKSS